ncbi:MAG TPA: hypothetical protein VMM85_05495 [Methylomirabilota bacterium]|nr:hypothetical protein [Methylomirabilota bacterium]
MPTERVWELLARGVLSGAPEGEAGMRVFLQPRPAPSTPDVRTNGHGENAPEASPFRELLSEFRNLTERYGQALLALGESRGEVAGLRSRVDLLEARMDLRLPSGASAASGWAAPMSPPLEERAVGPAEGAPEAETADDETAVRRRKGRSGRHPTEQFAEALARAQDPSPPELPGWREAAASIAALREETSTPDAMLPRELPPAEFVIVAEEEEEEEEAEAAPAAAAEPEPVVAGAESVVEVTPEPVVAEAESVVEVTPEPVVAVEPADGDASWDAERYTPQIEEPDWLSAEEFAPGPDALAAEPALAESPGVDTASDGPSGAQPEEAAEAEAAALPGSQELDEALAALDALAGRSPEPEPPPDEEPDGPAAIAVAEPAAAEAEPEPAEPAFTESAPVADAVPLSEQVVMPRPYRRETGLAPMTRSPASRAYRRLRRIFPS